MEGQNTATALRTNSYGSLISGVSDTAGIVGGFNFGGGKKNPAGYNNFDYGSGTGA